jgi:hypothetical protein
MRPEKLTGPIQRQANWFMSSAVMGTVVGAGAGAGFSAGFWSVAWGIVRAEKLRSAPRRQTLSLRVRKSRIMIRPPSFEKVRNPFITQRAEGTKERRLIEV